MPSEPWKWIRMPTFACELSVVLARTFVTANDTFDVLTLITAVDTVLRVLWRRLPVVDEREVGVVQGNGVEVRGQGVEVRRRQRVQRVGQRVQAGRYRVHQGRFAPGARDQCHFCCCQGVRYCLLIFGRDCHCRAQFPKIPASVSAYFENSASRYGARIRAFEVIGHPLGTL